MNDAPNRNAFDTELPDDVPLSEELRVAVDQVRARAASDAMVQRLHARLAAVPAEVKVRRQAAWQRRFAVAAAALVAVGVLVAIWPGRNERQRPAQRAEPSMLRESLSPVVYSPVTRTPFVDVAFTRINADLAVFDTELRQASEAVEWTDLQREIGETLEEFSSWNRTR